MLFPRIRQRVINGYHHIMACVLVKTWVVLIIVHFIAQITLQGLTLRDNMQAKDSTSLCLSLAQVPMGLSLLDGDYLNMCNGIPGRTNVTCIRISSTSGLPPAPSQGDVDANALTNFDLDEVHRIVLSGNEEFITGRCALSLQWIFDVFRDNAAEDIATICFQFWLLIVSLLAVLQDSIPHLVVCIASQFLDVGWAGFRIKSTITLRRNYYTFVVYGACEGKDALGDWWNQRLSHTAPLFGTNVIILILLTALSVVLFRRYANINFGRIGASPQITRMYKIALSFSAFLQLAAFFTIMAVGMWIDRISSGAMSALPHHIQIYQAGFFVHAAIIAPWIILGWWAIFREIKWAFILFGALHLIPLALWPTMFASSTFRYVLGTWSFFACVSVTSYLFVIATTINAIICRLHFGRGLAHFLRVEADLSSSGFPGSFFVNDPTHARGDSPTSFEFSFLDAKKARKGSMGSDKEGPMLIRPYTSDSSKYSVRSLTFDTSSNGSKTPIRPTFRPPGAAGAAIIRSLNKGSDKPLPSPNTDTDSPKSTIFPYDKERSWIQPPPDAYLQAPYRETRLRKETPSLITQATGTSSNSYTQAVVTFARRNPVVSATARTLFTSTMPSRRTPWPVDVATSREDCPGIDPGTGISINMVPQRRPTLVRAVNGVQRTAQVTTSADRETPGEASQDVPPRINFPPQSDSYGRF